MVVSENGTAFPCEEKGRIEIRPDMTEAAKQIGLLRRLSRRYDFPLDSILDSLAENGLPVWPCEVDWSTAPTAGYAVARYQLAERLQGALAALIRVAGYCDGDFAQVGNVIGHGWA
jgi:hypothetical protein